MTKSSKFIAGLLAIALLIGVGYNQASAEKTAKATGNIAQVATEAGTFKTLLAALKATGLDKAVVGEGPLTVFAPTDEAFSRLPAGTVENLLKKENLPKLAKILKYHVAAGRLDAKTLISKSNQITLIDQDITIRTSGKNVLVNGSKVVTANIPASNGIIHVIDTVLIPENKSAQYQDAMELIGMAIDRGVPLYNHGQAGACATVYEMTARSLLKMDRAQLPPGSKDALQAGLKKMSATHSTSRQAWAMRHALDQVMEMARN